jgi:hypothetical protein
MSLVIVSLTHDADSGRAFKTNGVPLMLSRDRRRLTDLMIEGTCYVGESSPEATLVEISEAVEVGGDV